RERTVVAGVHGLEHVQGFATAHLTHDDAVRPHAERVAHQVPDGDLAGSFAVGGTCLQADDVLLMKLELDGILDGDDALVVRHGDVQPGAGQQAGVHDGRRLVPSPPDLADDAIDDPPQVLFGDEPYVGPLDHTGALHVDHVGAVHHDLGDGCVSKERLDGTEA